MPCNQPDYTPGNQPGSLIRPWRVHPGNQIIKAG